MPVYITKEKKQELFKEFGGSENNTGSTQGQIALFTFRIQSLSEHLKNNHKDQSSRKALLSLVGKRKRLLTYLANNDIGAYRSLIEKLGIRK
ncbi:30S ribosomal protein S15 [Membranihabitans marinus]|uniref:30S ribosomal protein S15 n=1 Tax=Membranihabitans marinus TaxID=1227546 RepID=UPI001F01AC13|nr:30S ribosomal protein S15 [Membranihabitans marinus]